MCIRDRHRVGLVDHHVDEVIHLQGGHHTHDEGDEQGGGDHGQGDGEELLEAAGAVDAGGLIVALGDILQSGQQQHGVVADGAPDGHDGAGHNGGLGVGQQMCIRDRINGERTVGQLAQQLKEQFGDQAEPLYDRLVKYMQILRNNEFILFRGKDKVKE